MTERKNAILRTAALIVALIMILPLSGAISAKADGIPQSFDNPVIKTDADGNIFFSADPSVRVFDGKMYMYCSQDVFPANRCCNMDNYHVFSSVNGQDWTDEGQILSSYDLSWGHKGGYMWAPDCEKINGKYYFFYPHLRTQDDFSSWVTAVAVSDSPTGPFHDLGPISGANSYDPNVLVTSGGDVYLYWGGSQRLYGSKLYVNGDSVTLSGSTVELTKYATGFQEGAWCFEKDGKFYLTYAKGRTTNTTSPTLAYAVGSSPLGSFSFKGDMLSANPGTAMDTSHGSVVNYNGTWLMFYHNMALSGFECLRSVCAARMTFNSDGTIETVVPSPNTAPKTNKNEPADVVKYPINRTDWTVGNDGSGSDPASATFETNGSITNVGNLHIIGAYTETSVIDGGTSGGKAIITFQYSSLNEYSAIYPTVNGVTYSPAPAAPNGSWNTFDNYTQTTIMLSPGKNTLKITGGHGGVNVSAVYIKLVSPTKHEYNLSTYSLKYNSVVLGWTARENAARYAVSRLINGKWEFIKWVYDPAVAFAGLTRSTEYTYGIRAQAADKSYIDSEVQAITFKTPNVVIEKLSAISVGTTTASFSWKSVDIANKYVVAKYENGVWVTFKNAYTNSVNISGLEPETTYTIGIRPRKDAEVLGSFKTIEITTEPECIKTVSAETGASTAVLSWEKMDEAAKYQVCIFKDSEWVLLKYVFTNSVKLTGLSGETSYLYGIRGITSDKRKLGSTYSTVSFTTAASPKVNPVATTVGESSAILSWDAVPGIYKYRVYRYSGGTWALCCDTGSRNYVTVNGLAKNTEYKFGIRLMNASKDYMDDACAAVVFTTK